MNSYEMIVELDNLSADRFGLKLLQGEGRELLLYYDSVEQALVLDRTTVPTLWPTRNSTDILPLR